MKTTIRNDSSNKGGRPKTVVKRNARVTVMCTIIEKKLIQANARKVNVRPSIYLRELGLKPDIRFKLRVLPKEVLLLTGTLNHIAANLNQIARKRNKGEDLNAMDRALLNREVRALEDLVINVRSYLQ